MTRISRTSFIAAAALAATAALPGPASALPTITEYSSGLTTGRAPYDITTGPGGKLWFTLSGTPSGLGSIAPTGGAITTYANNIPNASMPTGMTFKDGTLYFTREADGKMGWTTDGLSSQEAGGGIGGGSKPHDVAPGPDGYLYYTRYANPGAIGRWDPVAKSATELTNGLTANRNPENIVEGPDGAMWFTERANPGAIGRLNPATEQITEFSAGLTPNSAPDGMTVGPDGALWFTQNNTNSIGRITTGGQIQEFVVGAAGGKPVDIVTGADGNLWFTQAADPGSIGRITPSGIVTTYTVGLTANSKAWQITSGPDGNVWFTENAFPGRIGRITVGPGVANSQVSDQSVSGATVTGRVSPNSQATTYAVRYGKSGAFDQTTTAVSAGAGAAAQNVSVALEGLEPGTHYGAQLVATNASDVTYGPLQNFTTTAAPLVPPVPPVPPVSPAEPKQGATPADSPSQPAPVEADKNAATQDEVKPAEQPTLGKTVLLSTKSGKVTVKKPGQPGGYVALGKDGRLPVGTLIDTRQGHVLLTSAIDASGATQTGEFWGGVFRVSQTTAPKGLTTLTLAGGNFAKACKKPKAVKSSVAVASATKKPHAVRSLWGSDKAGRFRTRGRDSVATVRGTKWVTEDFCSGTRTRVTEGAVDVTSLRTKLTVLVKAGHSYLARHKR